MDLNRNFRCLSHWEEAVGELKDIQEFEGHLLAKIGPVNVLLPPDFAQLLKGIVGKRIAVLRTDQDYKLRIHPDHDHN